MEETMQEYKFVVGSKMPKTIKANEVGLIIQRLITKRGEARPEDLVDDARRATHPLHSCFEWNDSRAAHAHRLDQARYILRSITIVRENRDPVRAFVNIERSGGWRSIEVVMSDPTDRQLLLEQALNDLRAFERKYRALEEMGPIHAAIAAVLRLKNKNKPKTKFKRRN
jgi:hypothetical protein